MTLLLTKYAPAALAWLAAITTAPRLVRAPHDARVRAVWRAIALLALALTLATPVCAHGLDARLGLPNAAQWLSDTFVLGTAQAVDEFLILAEYGSDGQRMRLTVAFVVWLLDVLVMAWLLWLTHLHADIPTWSSAALHGHVPPPLIAYQALYALGFGAMLTHLLTRLLSYRRLSSDWSVRISLTLTMIGACAAGAYFCDTLLLLILPPAATPTLLPLLHLSSGLAAGFTTCGVMIPFKRVHDWWLAFARRTGIEAAMRHVAACRDVWLLYPLWRALASVAPELVLPTTITWRHALAHADEMELLLGRRVIEILDVRRQLFGVEPLRASRGVAVQSGPDELMEDQMMEDQMMEDQMMEDQMMEDQMMAQDGMVTGKRAARQEAALLTVCIASAQLQAVGAADEQPVTVPVPEGAPAPLDASSTSSSTSTSTSTRSPVSPAFFHAYQPGSFDEQVRYLKSVAMWWRLYQQEQRVRRWLEQVSLFTIRRQRVS